MFDAMLRVDFKDRPGEEDINQGRFYILNDTNQQQIMSKGNWEQTVFPGTTVVMSMILSLVKILGKICPKPGCGTKGKRVSPASRFSNGTYIEEIKSLRCMMHILTNSSPECNLLYEPEEIWLREHSAQAMTQSENREKGDSRSQSFSDLTISQLRVASHVEDHQSQDQDLDRPRATKTHSRQQKAVIENKQYRQNARQKEMCDLGYFKRVHPLPSRNSRARHRSTRLHWALGGLTENKLVMSFKNTQR